MQSASVEARVRSIVASLVGKEPETLASDATWRNLGIDSLALFDLLVACEEAFEVNIPDEQALHFYCIHDLAQYLEAAKTRQLP